jgi:hypothetical protein
MYSESSFHGCREQEADCGRLELVGCPTADLLPGEEALHARLQGKLIETLACSHQALGVVVQIEAKIPAGSGSAVHGMLRSIQAAPGHYSCEFLEISPESEVPAESRFFTVAPPEEERSCASIILLAKAAALVECEELRSVSDGYFDAVTARDH